MKYNGIERNEFKHLLFKSIKFIIIFILVDLSFGFIAKEIFFSQKTGKFARLTHAIQKDSSEVLIMGSSHANRQFIPEILEKELNMSCYNAGVQGQYLIFHAALQKMILKKHKPQLLILNIDWDWLYESNTPYERLADLNPYYWDYRKEVAPIMSIKSKFNKVKLLSSAYQTNSTLVHAIKYFLQPQEDFKGYRPFSNKMKKPESSEKIFVATKSEEIMTLDTNFINVFEEFITTAERKNVNLIFIFSPTFVKVDWFEEDKSLNMLKSIANERKISLIDFSKDSSFYYKYDLFNDPGHLNNNGAVLVTNSLADSLKCLMKTKE